MQIDKREYLFSSLVQTSFVDIIDCSSFSEDELLIGATLGQHRAIQCVTSTQQVLFSLANLEVDLFQWFLATEYNRYEHFNV